MNIRPVTSSPSLLSDIGGLICFLYKQPRVKTEENAFFFYKTLLTNFPCQVPVIAVKLNQVFLYPGYLSDPISDWACPTNDSAFSLSSRSLAADCQLKHPRTSQNSVQLVRQAR